MEPTAQVDDGPTPQSGLDELVLHCLARLEREGLEALDELCRERPEHATALRRRIRMLREAGLLNAGDSTQQEFPERLGDFHLLRRLGGGGMGVVYLAEQVSLGRRVALKLIRPEQLYFPGSRSRFAREAQAIARLAHPGIVPVYMAGEENGIPYLAMEHVQGVTLAAVLARLAGRNPGGLRGHALADTLSELTQTALSESERASMPFSGSWFEACAWIAREVAQALEHAHQRGVIHRDVKPSNIMLTASGRVMLVDFGLASAKGSDQLTRSGSQQGSLPYMSPEQLSGSVEQLGAATDVYGLGVTLYECVALRRAYENDDPSALRVEILDARAPRLRARVASVPRDLEALVSVAMAPEASRRYSSAADLARDLTHVLQGEPIEARPAGLWHRSRRWAQRRPAHAVASVLAVLVVVGGPLTFGVIQASAAERERELSGRLATANTAAERANQELRTANESLERQRVDLAAGLAREQHERQRAQLNLDYALEAVDTMLTRVGDETLAQVPRMEEVRRELLEHAQQFYARFLDQESDDPEVRLRQAITLGKVGRILVRLGRTQEADCTYALAEDSLRELEARLPATAALRKAMCAALAGRTEVLNRIGRLEQAEGLQRELLDRLERAVAAEPGRRSYFREELSNVHMNLAYLDHARGEWGDAFRQVSDAALNIDLLLQANPSSPLLVHKRGVVLSVWADLETEAQNLEDGVRHYLEALEWLRSAHRARPDNPDFLDRLAVTLYNFGSTVSEAESHGGSLAAEISAEDLLAEAILVSEQLALQYPRTVRFRETLAASRANLCRDLTNQGRATEARAHGERAVEEHQRLLELDPVGPRRQDEFACALSALAIVCVSDGEAGEALPLLEQAIAAEQRALSSMPDNGVFTLHLAQHLAAQCQALLALGRWREAAQTARRVATVELPEYWRWKTAAEFLLDCAGTAQADTSLSDAERAEVREALRDEAVEMLAIAVDEGLHASSLTAAYFFESLEDHPAFRELIGLPPDDE